MEKIIIYTDWGARGNPGEAGVGVAVLDNSGNILKKVWAEKITRTAIVIIGDVVKPASYEYSKLYDKKFSHGYRKAKFKSITKN